MRRSYYELYSHLVWATKNRVSMINEEVENNVYNIVKDKCKKFEIKLIAVGSVEEHIHLLLAINPEIKIPEFAKEVKGSTSFFINHNTSHTLYWQDGYGVLSISKSGIKFVKEYVEKQKEHHLSKLNIKPILEIDGI